MNHVTFVLLAGVLLAISFLKQSFKSWNRFLFWPLSRFSLQCLQGGLLLFSTFRIYFGPMKPSAPMQLLVNKLPQMSAKWEGYTTMSLSVIHLVINSCNKYLLSAYSRPGSLGLSQWRQDPCHCRVCSLEWVDVGCGGETKINKQMI